MSVPHATTKVAPRDPSAATTIPRCRAISPTPRRLLFSHRNQWRVAVESIQRGFLEESVTLRLPSGSRMVAQVPLSTGSLLGICPGRHFTALVDPMAVFLEAGSIRPVVSCCNCLEATVTDATEAMDALELELSIGGVDRLHTEIPNRVGFREPFARGSRVWAIFPARAVLLATAA